MNRKMIVTVSAFCAVGMTLCAMGTAFAKTGSSHANTGWTHAKTQLSLAAKDSSHASMGLATASEAVSGIAGLSANMSSQSKTSGGVTVTVGKASTVGGSGKPSTHAQGKSALQMAIQQLHAAIATDKTDHAKLVSAMKRFQAALQQAIAAGDTHNTLRTAMTGAQGAMTSLHQALSYPQAASASQKANRKARHPRNLSNAINAIGAVTLRDEMKGKAMLSAATTLTGLTQTLTGSMSSSSNGTASSAAAGTN